MARRSCQKKFIAGAFMFFILAGTLLLAIALMYPFNSPCYRGFADAGLTCEFNAGAVLGLGFVFQGFDKLDEKFGKRRRRTMMVRED